MAEQQEQHADEIRDGILLLCPDSSLTLIRIRPDANTTIGRTFLIPDDIAAAVEWARSANEGGSGIYWSSGRVGGEVHKKPTKDDIVESPFAHVDVDPNLENGYAAGRQRLLGAALDELKQHASIVIDSGNGLQPLFRLDAPHVIKSPDDIAEIEEINRRLLTRFDGDPGTHNVDRLLRLPGTWNYPNRKKLADGYPKEPTRASVVFESERTFTLSDLDDMLPRDGQEHDARKASKERIEGDALDTLKARFELQLQTDRMLRERWGGSTSGLTDTSRSAMDMSMGALLRRHGYTQPETRAILTEWTHGAGADKSGDDRYFQRIWDRCEGRSGFTAEGVIDLLKRELPITDHDVWTRAIHDAGLGPVEVETVLSWLADNHVGSKRAINAQWKERSEVLGRAHHERLSARRVERAAGDRFVLEYDATQTEKMLVLAERELLERQTHDDLQLLHSSDVYCHVEKRSPAYTQHFDDPTLAVPESYVLRPFNRVSMRFAIERGICCVIWTRDKKGRPVANPVPVPDKLIDTFIQNPAPLAPHVGGLVTHPIVAPDGRIVDADGYDAGTGLYLKNSLRIRRNLLSGWDRRDAQRAYQDITELFEEFEFEDPDLDRALAVSALVTAVERRLMPQAPGYLFNARVQGSGKTTLARFIWLTVNDTDMAVRSYSTASGEEAQKRMLSTLIESPSCVVFDNIDDGAELGGGLLAAVITSPVFKQRLLGLNVEAEASTATLFVWTGNNVVVSADLARRIADVHLAPKSERPERRRFKHADVVRHVRSQRARMLQSVVVMVKAYIDAGRPLRGTVADSGMLEWDALVREPVLWASGVDVGAVFDRVREESVEVQGKVALVSALAGVFPGREFTASDVDAVVLNVKSHIMPVAGVVNASPLTPEAKTLWEVLNELEPGSGIRMNAKKLGNRLARLRGQVHQGLRLTSRIEHGRTRYIVSPTGEQSVTLVTH